MSDLLAAPEDGRVIHRFYDCTRCWSEIDRYETPEHKVNSDSVCRDCMELCPECGEYLDDDLGPMVQFIDPVDDEGQPRFKWVKSHEFHAHCGAERLLRYMAGDELFQSDYATRESIADVVANQAAPVKRSAFEQMPGLYEMACKMAGVPVKGRV